MPDSPISAQLFDIHHRILSGADRTVPIAGTVSKVPNPVGPAAGVFYFPYLHNCRPYAVWQRSFKWFLTLALC